MQLRAFVLILLFPVVGLCYEDDAHDLSPEIENFKQEMLERSGEVQEFFKDGKIDQQAIQSFLQKNPQFKEMFDSLDGKGLEKMMGSFAKNMKTIDREQFKMALTGDMAHPTVRLFFKKYPKMADIYVDIVRDEASLQGIAKIGSEKTKLRGFSFGVLISFVVGFMWRRKWRDRPFLNRSFNNLVSSIFLNALRLLAFYGLFQNELKPMIAIIGTHLS